MGGATIRRYFKEELAIKDLKQKRALRLVAISVVLLGCFSARTVANGPVRIMPLGDSITYGVGSTNSNSYRKPLYLALTDTGYNVDFVGSVTQNSGDPPDPNHEGHSGWHADGCPLPFPPGDVLDFAYDWLTANPADIILLHIGTNDITYGGEDANEVSDILDEIDRYEADSNEAITVILALIIDRRTHSSATTQFNIDVNAMAQSRIAAGDDITVVDMEHALSYPDDMYDNLHPNDAGYAKMATVWYNALDALLNGQRTLTISSTVGGSVIEPGEGPFVYDRGTDVNLIAVVDPNYYFVEWTGTAVDAGKVAEPNSTTTIVTVDADYTVVANFAADRIWDDGGDPNELWSESNNWDPDGIPTIADSAMINMAGASCLIDSSITAECSTLTVAYDTGPCYLDMTGGSLATNDNIIVGDEPNANGVFTISDGNVSCNRLWIGYGGDTVSPNSAVGTFIMTGGVVEVASKVELGKNNTGVGTIYIDGGTINVIGDNFEMGKYGNATMVLTAGDVDVAGAYNLKMSEGTGTARIDMYGGNIYCNDLRMNNTSPTAGTATINLYGGDINATDLKMYMGSVKPIIDIYEGTLIVQEDDWLDEIYQHVSDGWIIAYGGSGAVEVTPPSGGIGYITVTARMGDPNLAWSPTPRNYATVEWTPAGPPLSWKPGQYADSHDVYFGTVNPGNFQGSQDPCTFAFPSPPPVLGETYYWRIDEVNDAHDPCLWEGDVWEFTMDDHEEVEDFDSYADETALEAVWSLAGSTDITIEETIVQSGKSMKYEYDNSSSPYYSEASAGISGANKLPVDIQDWTSVGIKALTLYFSGDVNNAAEQMYVALRDTDGNLATVYYDDPNDLNEPEWHEWNIKLSDFTSPNDVNLNDVNKVHIGFGNRESPAAGGNGTVYFDDIQLYPTRCVASYAPLGDVDGDCIVNLADVNIMGDDWLEMDYTGVGYDGVLTNFTSPGCWVAGKYNNGLQFDGTDDWVDIDDSDFSNFRNKTIAFWAKIAEYPSVYRYMFYFSDDDADNPYRIYFMTRKQGNVRLRFLDDYTPDTLVGTGWHHLAFVLQDTADGRCTGRFYRDGTQVGDAMTARPRHSGSAVGVNIGSAKDGTSGFVKGRIDDFRVYDRSLLAAEVQTLYAGGEPDANMLLHYKFDEESGETAANSSTYVFNHPLLSDAELYEGETEGSRIVNFKDFAILANNWLKEQLWP